MSWDKDVKRLQSCIVERVEERDLDASSILNIVRSHEMGNVVVSARYDYQRALAFEIVQQLCRSAEQQRCSWMRSMLAGAADHCKHAILAYEWNEDPEREQERMVALAEAAASEAS